MAKIEQAHEHQPWGTAVPLEINLGTHLEETRAGPEAPVSTLELAHHTFLHIFVFKTKGKI